MEQHQVITNHEPCNFGTLSISCRPFLEIEKLYFEQIHSFINVTQRKVTQFHHVAI